MAQPHHITQLGNGLRIVTRPMPDSESVTLHIFIGIGGRHEDQLTENGLSHFLEHLLFKGTRAFPVQKELSEAIDRVGGYMNAYTTPELTTYFVKLPKEHLKLGLTVLTELVRFPLFDAVELDRERQVIVEEMNVWRDDPAQHVFDYVGGLLWPRDSLRTNVLGSEHVIRSVPREVVQAYHQSAYRPHNAVLAVAGNVATDEVQALAGELLDDWQGASLRQTYSVAGPLAETRQHIVTRDTAQAHIVVAGRSVAHHHPDEFATHILTAALGMGMSSRLFVKVREEQGLAYTIYMSNTNYIDIGKWEIYAGVNTQRVEAALESIFAELTAIREQPLSKDELDKVKQQLKGRVSMSQETNDAVADRLGTELLLTGKIVSIAEILECIDGVSRDDVLRVAQRYLDPSGIRMAAIAPASSQVALHQPLATTY